MSAACHCPDQGCRQGFDVVPSELRPDEGSGGDFEPIKRRTHVVRIFPNGESCLRLVRALAVETHENWLEQHRYLNMDDLREHKKEVLRRAA